MTILEEVIHSMQDQLYRANRQAAMEVNTINERLARIILDLGEDTVKVLSEYLQLQAVPDDFPFARRANLFFFLNPDHFLTGQVGPDVMDVYAYRDRPQDIWIHTGTAPSVQGVALTHTETPRRLLHHGGHGRVRSQGHIGRRSGI